MATTVRVTVTVPKDLKARMDAVEESINWSAVASRAFDQTLSDLNSRKGVRKVEDVINRLRASKRKHEASQYQEGFQVGRAWAEQSAEASELMQLAAIDDEDFWKGDLGHDGLGPFNPGEAFVFIIRPNSGGGRPEANCFWHEEAPVGGDEEPEVFMADPEYVRGFAAGAVELWEEVKDKL